MGWYSRTRARSVLDGVAPQNRSPRQARSLGIGMVHQHFTSVPALTVAENIALAAGWPVAPRRIDQRTRRLSERIGLPLDPDQRAGRLSVALKQRLEIVKALAGEARILLLDEPTAVLAPAEAERLLRMIRVFTEAGGAVVLITHKLDEALRAADRVTVLRAGAVTYAGSVAGQTVQSLTSAMIGQTLLRAWPHVARSNLRVGSRCRAGEDSMPWRCLARAVTVLRCAKPRWWSVGERLSGIAAVEGNGQREFLRAIAGRIEPLRGRLQVNQTGRVHSRGPHDRRTDSRFHLTENVVLGLGRMPPGFAAGG